jgi:rod shape-determining protein MreB
MIGGRTAEQLKMAVGAAHPTGEKELQAEVRGRDLVSGLPKTVVMSESDVRLALEESIIAIVDAVRTSLDKCPPELSGDIMDRGVAVTGGGALLRGLDERLLHETGMPIHLAENALDSVVVGSGTCVENYERLNQVLVPERRR